MRSLPPLLLALAGCAAPAAEPRAWSDLAREVRPSLEQIFLEPPLCGTPPAPRALSPDGAWLLFEWSPPVAQVAPGPQALEPLDPTPALRLLAVGAPSASAFAGVPLADVLGLGSRPHETGDEEQDPELDTWTWSHAGALLAVAHRGDVFLVDPGGERVTLALRGEVRSGEEGAEKPPEVRTIAFSPDDRSLRIGVDEELYVLPVAGGTRTLADATPVSLDVRPEAHRVQWSRDLTVAFANLDLRVRGEVMEDEVEEMTEEDPEAAVVAQEPAPREEPQDTGQAPPKEQVWLVSEGRGVTLEGMDQARDLDQATLSPDGRFVFAVEVDRSGEPERTLVPDYLTERVTTRRGRRQLADAVPSPWRAWVWDARLGTRVELFPEATAEQPAESAEPSDAAGPTGPAESIGAAWWVRFLGWAPQEEDGAPARFALQRTSADFRQRELWIWDEGTLSLAFSERDERWIGGPASYARWSARGTQLLVGSETTELAARPGFSQLFAVDAAGRAVRQLTDFAGEMTGFQPLPDGGVLVEGSGPDLARTSVAFLPQAQVEGREPARPRSYAVPEGWNDSVSAASDGSRIVFAHEELFQPAELWTADAQSAAVLTRTIPRAFREVDWIRPERIHVRTDDGRTVWAHVYLPPGVSLARPGPARATVFFVHGAGYLQNVTDSMTRYPLNMMFHSQLAHMGYPVVDVDYRGSAGYGRDFRGDVQYHLGGKDLDDIHLVLDRLVEDGLIDPARVGLYGGSYGGFLTLMALFTAPERWAVGAALRSVTDWRTYHPTYTQPRLGRPSTHPEAYARSSPIDLVDGARDPVLILHGMVDSNVFAQDSIRLIEAMIDRGKEFEAMLYPSQGHAFEDGPHWLDEYRRIERYLLRHLGPALPAVTDSIP